MTDKTFCQRPSHLGPAGLNYIGKVSQTIDGIECQRWDVQTPNGHWQSSYAFPELNITLAENYCRNPDHDNAAWCYAMSSTVRWGFCNITICGKCIYVIPGKLHIYDKDNVCVKYILYEEKGMCLLDIMD